MPKRLAKARSKEQIVGGYDPLPIGIGSGWPLGGPSWPLGGPSVALGWPKGGPRVDWRK